MARSHKTRYSILGMLSIEPMSGYDIKRVIAGSTAHFWAESDGQLYPALAELLKNGLVKIQPTTDTSKRPRKFYAITKEGSKVLTSWLQQDPEKSQVRHELLLKLFFGKNVATTTMQKHLAEFQRDAEKSITLLKQTENALKENEKNSPHLPYWLITIDYGKALNQAKLQWCKKTRATLTSIKG